MFGASPALINLNLKNFFITCGLLEFSKDKVTKGNALYLAGWTEYQEVEKQVNDHLCATNYTEGIIATTYFLPLKF